MGSYRELETYCKWILENIEKIESYTQGVTYEQFCTNIEKQDACYMVCIVLGETTNQLSKYHPQNPIALTTEMRQLRNFIAHQYHKIDKRIIRNVITQELPKVKTSIQQYLNK